MAGKPKTEAANYERLTLRIPSHILHALRTQAREDHRALNTHVWWCLEQFLSEHKEKKYEGVRSRKS